MRSLISIDFNNKNVMRCAFVCPVFDTLQFNIDSRFIYIVYANAFCCLNIVSVLFSQFFFFFGSTDDKMIGCDAIFGILTFKILLIC